MSREHKYAKQLAKTWQNHFTREVFQNPMTQCAPSDPFTKPWTTHLLRHSVLGAGETSERTSDNAPRQRGPKWSVRSLKIRSRLVDPQPSQRSSGCITTTLPTSSDSINDSPANRVPID